MITTDIQVRFSDVDRLQHINNVVLQQYYDLGKVQYFKSVLSISNMCTDITFIVVNTNTNYYEELFGDDKFHVTTRIIKVGTKSITLRQEIVDIPTQRVKGCSESVLVAFDLRERVSVEIPSDKRAMILAYEGGEIY
ncbi:MAG: thioesterase family protein [Rikenellaceae bacterium]